MLEKLYLSLSFEGILLRAELAQNSFPVLCVQHVKVSALYDDHSYHTKRILRTIQMARVYFDFASKPLMRPPSPTKSAPARK